MLYIIIIWRKGDKVNSQWNTIAFYRSDISDQAPIESSKLGLFAVNIASCKLHVVIYNAILHIAIWMDRKSNNKLSFPLIVCCVHRELVGHQWTDVLSKRWTKRTNFATPLNLIRLIDEYINATATQKTESCKICLQCYLKCIVILDTHLSSFFFFK